MSLISEKTELHDAQQEVTKRQQNRIRTRSILTQILLCQIKISSLLVTLFSIPAWKAEACQHSKTNPGPANTIPSLSSKKKEVTPSVKIRESCNTVTKSPDQVPTTSKTQYLSTEVNKNPPTDSAQKFKWKTTPATFLVLGNTNPKNKFSLKLVASWPETCRVPSSYQKHLVPVLMMTQVTLKSSPKTQCGLYRSPHDKICIKTIKSVRASMITIKTTKKLLLLLLHTISAVTKEISKTNPYHLALEPTNKH